MRTDKLRFLTLLLLAGLWTPRGTSQVPQPVRQVSVTSPPIEKWIKDLDSRDFRTRERASEELLTLREQAVEPLKKAVASQKLTLEATLRVKKLLRQIAVYDFDGEAVHGLRLFLSASKDTIRTGDELILVTILTNESDKDLFVPIGLRPTGNDFARGSNLRCLSDKLYEPDFGLGDEQKKLPPAGSTILRAKTSITYRSVATLSDNRGARKVHTTTFSGTVKGSFNSNSMQKGTTGSEWSTPSNLGKSWSSISAVPSDVDLLRVRFFSGAARYDPTMWSSSSSRR